MRRKFGVLSGAFGWQCLGFGTCWSCRSFAQYVFPKEIPPLEDPLQDPVETVVAVGIICPKSMSSYREHLLSWEQTYWEQRTVSAIGSTGGVVLLARGWHHAPAGAPDLIKISPS